MFLMTEAMNSTILMQSKRTSDHIAQILTWVLIKGHCQMISMTANEFLTLALII